MVGQRGTVERTLSLQNVRYGDHEKCLPNAQTHSRQYAYMKKEKKQKEGEEEENDEENERGKENEREKEKGKEKERERKKERIRYNKIDQEEALLENNCLKRNSIRQARTEQYAHSTQRTSYNTTK